MPLQLGQMLGHGSVWAPIVSDIRGACVRIRFQNGVRPRKRAAGREFCRFSLVVC